MKVLFLSNWWPYPPNNGSKIRILNLLSGLSTEHRVSLVAFTENQLQKNGHGSTLNSMCEHIYAVPRPQPKQSYLRSGAGLLSTRPRILREIHASGMADAIRQHVDTFHPDLVIASQWNMAAYASAFGGRRAVLEELELGAFYSKKATASGLLSRLRHTLPLIKMRHFVRHSLPNFVLCTVSSENERLLASNLAPDYPHIEVIPNFVDLRRYSGRRRSSPRNILIFTGSLTYFPNSHGMQWFLSNCLPKIKERIPDAKLTITGALGRERLPEVPGVTHLGLIPDVRELLAASSVSIVPIHLGGGTRLKVLEAMAARTPIVATSKGVEGLDVEDNEHLLIADEPSEFAEATIRILQNPRLRKRLVDNAFALVGEKYDFSAVMPRFLGLVEKAALG